MAVLNVLPNQYRNIMKKLLLTCLCLISGLAFAASSAIFNMLDSSSAPAPIDVLFGIEQRYAENAVIVEFEFEIEKGQRVYEVTLYQTKKQRFIELLLDHSGHIIEQEYEQPELDEQEEIAAANLMTKKGYTLHDLVKQLDDEPTHYLIEAQLEQDMGITYMVATFVTNKGRHKKAIDLETGKNLPLLRWGN